MNFLELGGSKFPLDELMDASVATRSPQPVKQATKYFDDLVNQLISEYRKL